MEIKKQKLTQSWRWYGPNDPVSLTDIRQAGATSVVSALHHIPHGEVWPLEAILARKNEIEQAGLIWEVVESVPVHEAIKTRSHKASDYIENYKSTLLHLSQCGIKTICYNFMPVLDWTRTNLAYKLTNGAQALHFDWEELAMFDIYILERENAEKDYTEEILQAAKYKFDSSTEDYRSRITGNILMGIPNEQAIELNDLRNSIELYQAIGREGLKDNLQWFLSEIADVCMSNGIQMTIHPDDPPYAILGLPRIASTYEDYVHLLKMDTRKFHGFCFCTGSLGAHHDNNIQDLFELVKDRVYFLHLRNIRKDQKGNFYESDHLDGDVDMVVLMQKIIDENQLRSRPKPFRPDHGHQILDDLQKETNPGYSAIGRLKGLAELRGLEMGIIGY